MQHANAVAPVATQPLINYNALPGIPCPICASEKYEIVTLRFDGGRIVQCLQCGHKYLNPTLTDDILKAIYTDYHEAESDESVIAMVSNWFAQPDSPYQYVLQKLELDGGLNGKRVVEVGCGPGKFLNECRLRGAIVAGVDISPGAVRMAKNFFGLELIPKTVEQAIIDEDLKADDSNFVFAFEIIEHVHKPKEFIQSLFQLLAPGGYLFISTPNFHLYKLMGQAAEVVTQWPEHLHFFEPDTFEQCLALSGFTDIQIISTGQKSAGERQKQVLARKPLINALWRRIRRVRAIYALKNLLFKAMDQREELAGETCWNGMSLLGCARKPLEKIVK